MEKYVLGLIVLLALSGCSSSTEEPSKQKSNTGSTSTVTTSMSSSSATSTSTIESTTIESHEPITVSDATNQKFVTAFQEAGLGMYLETGYGVNDYTNDEKIYIILQNANIVSGMNFIPEEYIGEFNNIMTVQNYASPDEMNAAAEKINSHSEDVGIHTEAFKNENTNSLFIYKPTNDQEIVKKYLDVFYSVK